MLPRLDQFDYHHTLEDTPGISLVCFTTPHCGACKAMRRALERLGAVDPALHLFEVDGQRDLALTRELEVFHLPSLFLYHDGEFHAELQCEPLPGRLAAAIVQRLALPADDPP